MPPDSNWNTPRVSPRQKRSSTFSIGEVEFFDVDVEVLRFFDELHRRVMTDSVRRPRKSIFSKPHFSAMGPSNCVRMLSSLSL